MQPVHAVRNIVLWQLSARPSHVEVVDEHHAILGLQHHRLGEHRHQFVEGVLCIWLCRVVYEDYAVCIFLNRCPTFFVLEVAAAVPQLNVDLPEISNAWRRISLEINDSIINLILGSENYLQPIVCL